MTPYYDEDGITIYQGDCREILPYMCPLDDHPHPSRRAIVTDPPYAMGNALHRPGYGRNARWAKLHGEGRPGWDTTEAHELVRTLPERSSEVVIWGGNFFGLPPARGWLVWNKIIRNWSSSECELAWTNLDQPVRAFDYSHGQLAHEGKVHPTQKPLDLMRWCLSLIEADEVIDPFMGSGTTLVAAHDLGKKAIGIEIEEKYCEIAVQRLAQGVLPLGR